MHLDSQLQLKIPLNVDIHLIVDNHGLPQPQVQIFSISPLVIISMTRSFTQLQFSNIQCMFPVKTT